MLTSALHALLLAVPALAAVYTVDVGQSGLSFSPRTVSAKNGDTVIFHLYSPHDVAQGDFSSPCTPSSNGFYSGSYSGTDGGKKKFVVNVTSDSPVYYYCTVQKHCQSGMVGGINLPSSGNTIDTYANNAKGVQQGSAPSGLRGGQLLEDEQISSLTAGAGATASSASGSSTATGSAATTTSGAPASGSATPSSSGSAASAAPSSTGAAVGGQVPAAAAAVLGFVAWFL